MHRIVIFAAVVTFASPIFASAGSRESKNAHPVSVIEADIYVTKFKTTMRLRCFAEDLDLLQGVEALEDGFYDSEELHDATEDHADFLAEKIELIAVDGSRIPARVIEIDHFEIPEARIRQGELMKYTIGVVLEFNYDKPPEFLTITQKIIAAGLKLPSELKILLKQEGSDEPYFQMMKPDQPETFRFDWTNPIPASDASDEERESWFEEQREKTLGITSYSSVYSFIYITNYQIRHEVLIPLATLNTFFDLDRAEESFLDIAEQDVAAEQIKAMFSIGNPVVIDNVEVKPIFDRIDFYGLDFRDFAVKADRRKVSMANGRVGVIMSYSTKGMPREVKVTWDKFNDVLKTVDAVVFAFDEVDTAEFSMFLEDNTYEWSSKDRKPPASISNVTADFEAFAIPKIKLPVVSVVLGLLAIPLALAIPFCRNYLPLAAVATALVIGCFAAMKLMPYEMDHPFETARAISEEQASDIFEQLHKNMFRAFDYHNENDIYDALARSVEGDQLRKLYLEIIDSLRVSEQGGAVSSIEEVKIVGGKMVPAFGTRVSSDRPEFCFRSQWELLGTVEHWAHIHERNNKYDAQFKVELVGNDWKITDMQVEDFSHDAIKTRQRKL